MLARAFGQVHQLKCLQPLDAFQHVPRVASAVPGSRARTLSDAAAGLELQIAASSSFWPDASP